jgi:hypothetical protein
MSHILKWFKRKLDAELGLDLSQCPILRAEQVMARHDLSVDRDTGEILRNIAYALAIHGDCVVDSMLDALAKDRELLHYGLSRAAYHFEEAEKRAPTADRDLHFTWPEAADEVRRLGIAVHNGTNLAGMANYLAPLRTCSTLLDRCILVMAGSTADMIIRGDLSKVSYDDSDILKMMYRRAKLVNEAAKIAGVDDVKNAPKPSPLICRAADIIRANESVRYEAQQVHP